jgi:23S rRNA (guanine745-N1)-methyltransferase
MVPAYTLAVPAATLLCTVRGCGRPLQPSGRSLACARGHAFDRARRGFVNLLQPQDRRSRQPGDSRGAALARRRLCEAGLEAPLHERLLSALADVGAAIPAVLDVGCGEGSGLAWLATRHPLVAHGLDLSVEAVDLAARLLPAGTWVVANADRGVPFADASFDVALSVLARRPAAELARVLRPEGLLLVAVPGPDDLAELRTAVQGEAPARERLDGVVEELAGCFELTHRERLSWRATLDRPRLEDLLASSYRGARARERDRFAGLERLEVTFARDLGWFRPSDLQGPVGV